MSCLKDKGSIYKLLSCSWNGTIYVVNLYLDWIISDRFIPPVL